MTQHPPAPEEKPPFLQKLKSLLLNKTVLLFAAAALLILSISIAAVARYASNKKKQAASSAAENAAHDAFYAYLETLLPSYGVVPAETNLHIAETAGVLAVYLPADDREMVVCRTDARSLVLDRYTKAEDGTVQKADSAEYKEVFAAVFSAKQSLTICAEPKGMTVGGEPVMQLANPPADPVTVAVLKAAEKQRSWEMSVYLLRDMTYFREHVALPEKKAAVKVPDFSSMTYEEAKRLAVQHHVNVAAELKEDTSVPRGTVTAQSLPAESETAPDTTVYLTVAAESFFFRFEVPAQTAGEFKVTLYVEDGKELVSHTWQRDGTEQDNALYLLGLKAEETCDFRAVLENPATGKTVSLGAYTVGADNQIKADPEIVSYAFSHADGLYTEPAVTAPQETTPVPADEAEWKTLYRRYLNDGLAGNFKKYHQSMVWVDLIYLDDDRIPELVLAAPLQNQPVAWICQIIDGQVKESSYIEENFYYLERKNRIFTERINSYHSKYLISELTDGQFRTLQSFESAWTKEKGYTYKLDARTVEREEFDETRKKAYDLPERVRWEYLSTGWQLTDENIKKHLS